MNLLFEMKDMINLACKDAEDRRKHRTQVFYSINIVFYYSYIDQRVRFMFLLDILYR